MLSQWITPLFSPYQIHKYLFPILLNTVDFLQMVHLTSAVSFQLILLPSFLLLPNSFFLRLPDIFDFFKNFPKTLYWFPVSWTEFKVGLQGPRRHGPCLSFFLSLSLLPSNFYFLPSIKYVFSLFYGPGGLNRCYLYRDFFFKKRNIVVEEILKTHWKALKIL